MVINMSYVVNGKEYNMNSSKNQRIISKFVNREVYSNVTDMVEFILQNSYGDACGEAPFTNDDIENIYVDNSDEIEQLNDYLEELNDELEELESEIEELESDLEDVEKEFEEEPYRIELRDDIKYYNEEIKEKINERISLLSNIKGLENEVSDLESEQDEPNEVYSWYIVSGWLCDKLKGMGEVVIDNENLWGRGTCGQSISLDWVIGCICKNMEILEGQKYEWEV